MWVKKGAKSSPEAIKEIERKQAELTEHLRTLGENQLIHDSFFENCAKDPLFTDMVHYASFEGKPAPLVPFEVMDWPIYQNMGEEQLAWYFYWRSQVRQGTYLPTKDEYIYLYLYETLSGIGWKIPQDGYDRLVRLWEEYAKRPTPIRQSLLLWIFDFAELHGLKHTFFLEEQGISFIASTKVDVLVEQHVDDMPLKLTFDLLHSLCDHPFDKSKFYDGENKSLLREALPRVIALADAALHKKTKKGILKTYGPKTAKQESLTIFEHARCPNRYKRLSITVKPYSKNKKLRGYITELVRHSENVLRDIKGFRGRLQGITLDHETARLIEAFLKREYGPPTLDTPDTALEIIEKGEIGLNFENIGALREQSNAVRTALQVEDAGVPDPNALLPDVQDIEVVFDALSSKVLHLLDRLEDSNWKSEWTSEDETLIAEIKKLAKHPGFDVSGKKKSTIKKNASRDNPPKRSKKKVHSSLFNLSALPDTLRAFIERLTPQQQKALHALLTSEYPERDLEQIAEESMTLSHILLDDINEMAIQILGDLLIESMDQEFRVLDEYVPHLKLSIIER